MQVELGAVVTEPVSYTEAKDYLKLSNDVEQDLIESLITSARIRLEQFCNQAFVNRTIVCTFSCMDGWRELPYQPNAEITSVENEDGDEIEYEERYSLYKQIKVYSTEPVVVTYDAGFSTLPEIYKTAILKEVSSNYWNRETDSKGVGKEAMMLLSGSRRMTFLGIL